MCNEDNEWLCMMKLKQGLQDSGTGPNMPYVTLEK